jgi:hypothetical protein
MKTAEQLFGSKAEPWSAGCSCGGNCGMGSGGCGCASGGSCACESSGGCQDKRSPGSGSTAVLVLADYEGEIWSVPDDVDDARGVSSRASGAADGRDRRKRPPSYPMQSSAPPNGVLPGPHIRSLGPRERNPLMATHATASRERVVEGGTASSVQWTDVQWTEGYNWCAAMFVDCCVEVWCRPINNRLLRAVRPNVVHCAVIVKTCDGQYVTYELEDQTVAGNRVAQQGSKRGLEFAAEGRGPQAFVLTDSVDVDANGLPTDAGWWWHHGVCYDCDGCLDPCRVTEDQLLSYPHLGTDYGGPSVTYPNSNTFARWVAEQAGYDDSVGPPGAVGWSPP